VAPQNALPKEDTEQKLSSMGYGFFIPVFFITTGVNLNLRKLFTNKEALLLIPIFLVAFLLSKAIVYFVYRKRFGNRYAIAASIVTSTIDPALKAELDAVNQLDFGHYCEKLLHYREQREGV